MTNKRKTATSAHLDKFRPFTYIAPVNSMSAEEMEIVKKRRKYIDKICYPALSDVADMYGEAEKKADAILAIINQGGGAFPTFEPVTLDSLTIMCLIAKIDNRTIDIAQRIFSDMQSTRGQRQKRDALQILIETIVKENPRINQSGLLKRLESQIHQGVITNIIDEQIEWEEPDRKIGQAPIAGLKDRLSRAKKKLKNSDSR